jgi:riboflavin biosynthesis pyrimidine reductase
MGDALSARPWITPIVMNRPSDLAEALEQLRTMGMHVVSCVGGHRLATQLIDAGLVQDVYLTTAPRPGGEPETPMYPRPLNSRLVSKKAGTNEERGVVFEHLRITSA